MTERRKPATEAGRRLASWMGNVDAILAIEAQATDARVAALEVVAKDAQALLDALGKEGDLSDAVMTGVQGLVYALMISDLPAAAAERRDD